MAPWVNQVGVDTWGRIVTSGTWLRYMYDVHLAAVHVDDPVFVVRERTFVGDQIRFDKAHVLAVGRAGARALRGGNTLMATLPKFCSLTAKNTFPIPPSPKGLRIR